MVSVPFCYALKDTQLYSYFPAKDRWTVVSLEVGFTIGSETAVIQLCASRLFAVPPRSDPPFVVTVEDGSVEIQPRLLRPRHFLGLCLYQECVYAFGGRRCFQPSKLCERFPLHSTTWLPLPDCIQARQAFNPVLFQQLLYLPNGQNETIETFHPVSELFTLLPCRTGLTNTSASLILGHQLLVFGLTGCYTLDLKTQEGVKKDYSAALDTVWSQYQPVVYRGEMALVWPYADKWSVGFVSLQSLAVRAVKMPKRPS